MPSYPKLKLTYFDMAARAEAIRLAFHIGGIPFEDERLSREAFAQRKPDLVYGQVPVLEVDGVELAQSQAILRYAGKLADLYPVNDSLAALQVDEVIAGLEEMMSKIRPSIMETDAEKKKAMRVELATITLPRYLSILNARLTEMKKNPVFQDDHVWIHELAIYVQVEHQLKTGRLEGIPTDIAKDYVELMAAVNKVANHPKVQQWNAMHASHEAPKLKLTYYNYAGRAEMIRVAFVVGGIPFEDEIIERSDVSKLQHMLPFGQAPVLDVNGQILAQSLPILRYAGTVAGLYPSNDPLLALRIDELISLNDDMFAAASPVVHMPQSDARVAAAKTLVETTLPALAANVDKRIASWGGPYAVGETMTIADVFIYSMLENFKMFEGRGLGKTSVDAFKNVQRVYSQVREHPRVQAWLAQRK